MSTYNNGDLIEFNSDPESDDEAAHTHIGKIVKIGHESEQVAIQLVDGNNTIYEYFQDEIKMELKNSVISIQPSTKSNNANEYDDSKTQNISEDKNTTEDTVPQKSFFNYKNALPLAQPQPIFKSKLKSKTVSSNPKRRLYCHNFDEPITKCSTLSRLIETLKYCQLESNNAEAMTKYFKDDQNSILDDYHHVLEHLNEDKISKTLCSNNFEYIYGLIKSNNLKCDIEKCMVFTRNNRGRERTTNQKMSVEMDILDSIHCYFLHSVDVGYRMLNEDELNNIQYAENEDTSNQYYDIELQKIRAYMDTKMRKLHEIRGKDRSKHNKFVTHAVQTANDAKEDEKEKHKQSADYSFGLRYGYINVHRFTTEQSYDFTNLKPKYSTLKEEILSNKIYSLDLAAYENACSKAAYLLTTREIRQMFRYNDQKYSCLLVVIFYTDYDTLSFKFSETFRKTHKNETNQQILSRNLEYGNWTELLIQAVNNSGTYIKSSKIDILYHGVSLMYFSSFISIFNSPTSTTPNLQVAYNFASPSDGIILELSKYPGESTEKLKYLNCTPISNFPNEQERLFVTPDDNYQRWLKIVGIRNTVTNENYSGFVNTIIVFQELIDFMKDNVSNVSLDCINKINDLMKAVLARDGKADFNKEYPSYVLVSMEKWANSVKEICIDKEKVKTVAPTFAIWNDKESNILQLDKLNKIFKNVTKINCRESGTVNKNCIVTFLKILTKVSKLRYSKLKRVWLEDVNVVCSLCDYKNKFERIGWRIHDGNALMLQRI